MKKLSVVKRILLSGLVSTMALSLTGFGASAKHVHHHHHHHIRTHVLAQTPNQVNNQPNLSQPIKNKKHNRQYKHIFRVAKSKLGDKYAWGATGPKRFDCAGFTQYIYQHGIHKTIPRTAGAQYESAKHISRHHEKPGDLVFFGHSKHAISHVGMYIGKGNMIDAQLRGVVIEKINVPWWHQVAAARPAHLH